MMRTFKNKPLRPCGRDGFTLIELVVSLGLTALFLSMVATIFFQASNAFSVARSSVIIHQNARAALAMMQDDLAAAQLCEYEDKKGYFAFGWEPDERDRAVQFFTFTTLAEQPGARALVKDVASQVALVKYTLQWDGGAITVQGDNPQTSATETEYQAATYNLIKQVRFPLLANYFCDMNDFFYNWMSVSGTEYPLLENNQDEYVSTDVLAMGVYDMQVRVLYKGGYIEVLDHGRVTSGNGSVSNQVTVSGRGWPDLMPPALAFTPEVRILGHTGAPQEARDLASSAGNALTVNGNFSPGPDGDMDPATTDGDTSFRIEKSAASSTNCLQPENEMPEWMELPDRTDTVTAGTTYQGAVMYPMYVFEQVTPHSGDVSMSVDRMPYMVEITLKLADPEGKIDKTFTFTRRFAIPSALK